MKFGPKEDDFKPTLKKSDSFKPLTGADKIKIEKFDPKDKQETKEKN